MAAPGIRQLRKLPESVRHRVDVATAMAWQALVAAHAQQALDFVELLREHMPLEETLLRYAREMDMSDTMAAAVRTRVLVTIEKGQDAADKSKATLDLPRPDKEEKDGEKGEEGEGWRRFRPDVVMRGVFERQRKNEEVEGLIELALARAEEAVIHTHVDNAITFAALLDGFGPYSLGVEQYLLALGITGGRGQAILQRTMAKLADVHLPSAKSRKR